MNTHKYVRIIIFIVSFHVVVISTAWAGRAQVRGAGGCGVATCQICYPSKRAPQEIAEVQRRAEEARRQSESEREEKTKAEEYQRMLKRDSDHLKYEAEESRFDEESARRHQQRMDELNKELENEGAAPLPDQSVSIQLSGEQPLAQADPDEEPAGQGYNVSSQSLMDQITSGSLEQPKPLTPVSSKEHQSTRKYAMSEQSGNALMDQITSGDSEGAGQLGQKDSDKEQSAVWIEGDNADEVKFHKSVCAGSPDAEHKCYSFGVNDKPMLEGEVYEDEDGGGEILEFKQAPKQEVQEFQKKLDSELGETGTYGIDDICITYSNRKFKEAPGKTMAPPDRKNKNVDENKPPNPLMFSSAWSYDKGLSEASKKEPVGVSVTSASRGVTSTEKAIEQSRQGTPETGK